MTAIWRRGRRLVVLAALVSCGKPAPPSFPGPLGDVEGAFLEARSLADRIGVAKERGVQTGGLEPWYREARARLVRALAAADSATMGPEDRAALRTIRTVTGRQLTEDPSPAVGDAGSRAVSCDYDADALLAGPEGVATLTDRIMACYGLAAGRIPFDGQVLDRLTIFGLLGETDDRASRQRLFLALEPVWRSVNGDGSASSPWRKVLARRAERWRTSGMPHVSRATALGVAPDSVAPWLERVLDAWRATLPDTLFEPWDWHHYTGAADRRLASWIPRERLLAINHAWFRSLGADPDSLRIRYDIDPRPGKYPVAYTTFGDRPYQIRSGAWWPGEPSVFATYRAGGLGNLIELLHETGHGIHIAGIRVRPAFADWPDSDTFTEAVADLASFDAYEPRWQVRVLGDSVTRAEGLRAKYGGVVLDMAWALFEIRMFADPAQDPNQVWADITSRHLKIRPHPEWSWWAMRGQLIDGPGYMLNYALGSLLTAQLRARIREQRGSWIEGDLGWYPSVRDALFRWGDSRPTREVVEEFLGGGVRPDAVLAELRGRGEMLR